ncbi:MAG: hypothetical protein F6J90_01345 [Moorea sp. SIOASIH]|uniref:Small integral membrane protein n=1 Tax=Moorena producens PAL-8-15-08-1 TaxID=1458985 RepID=A0A1D8TP42_9CYAN|nr:MULTISPECIES: TMEM14 family protein [Moorena]AOW99332.1 hypothetical protein BJP34_07560 [Moorena producens PAL-8-15-08-1]NEO35020.1 hypothetical protein [Moorena sp. SIOASIH]NEO95495.1 hypothetical protein [Moorena sp. SIO3G5]
MNLSIAAVLLYGILALIGGIMGYAKAKSKISLISGLISGLLLIFAGIMQLQGQPWAQTLGIAVAAALVIVFAIRLAKTRKFMPAGLMIIAGVVSLGVMLYPAMA